MVLQIAVVFTPLRTVLHLEEIHGDALWACLISVAVMGLFLELHKAYGRWRNIQV
jgi:hypothetical protein